MVQLTEDVSYFWRHRATNRHCICVSPWQSFLSSFLSVLHATHIINMAVTKPYLLCPSSSLGECAIFCGCVSAQTFWMFSNVRNKVLQHSTNHKPRQLTCPWPVHHCAQCYVLNCRITVLQHCCGWTGSRYCGCALLKTSYRFCSQILHTQILIATWLIEWLIDWLTDWLIDWYYAC